MRWTKARVRGQKTAMGTEAINLQEVTISVRDYAPTRDKGVTGRQRERNIRYIFLPF